MKQLLSDDIADENEKYEFTWVGKKASILEANKSIRKTLRPCKEESVNWDTTENLYIEGDNLEALKLLQESYLGKIKMIYIDPPYNTGKDFIYNDSFKMDKEKYKIESGVKDEIGNRLLLNLESNGRFHSDWCSMIYSRLILSRNLLTDDGVIFISIDDNEHSNLKKICDEVFGEENYISDLIRKTKSTTNDTKTGTNIQHEICLIYSKDKRNISLLGNEKDLERYKNPDDDPNGPWISDNPSAKSGNFETGYFPVINPYTGKEDYPPEGRFWIFSKNTLQKHIDYGTICFKKEHKENERGFIYKRYLKDLKTTKRTLDTLLFTNNQYMNQVFTKELKELRLVEYFSYPKGINFIKELLIYGSKKDSIILDFFSGSSTTAHSVMKLNSEDNGNRKYIMIQLPEKTDEKSEAYKVGYRKITEIGKERIRRAGKKILEENPLLAGTLDVGFRVFKVDESNMKDVYYNPNEISQSNLFDMLSNIKEDRTDLDLLFGCLLEWGLPLSMPYSSFEIDNIKIHDYNNGDLIACFDENITEEVIKEIAKKEPLRVVFRDSSFKDDASKTNVVEIFKMLSADTKIKVI